MEEFVDACLSGPGRRMLGKPGPGEEGRDLDGGLRCALEDVWLRADWVGDGGLEGVKLAAAREVDGSRAGRLWGSERRFTRLVDVERPGVVVFRAF